MYRQWQSRCRTYHLRGTPCRSPQWWCLCRIPRRSDFCRSHWGRPERWFSVFHSSWFHSIYKIIVFRKKDITKTGPRILSNLAPSRQIEAKSRVQLSVCGFILCITQVNCPNPADDLVYYTTSLWESIQVFVVCQFIIWSSIYVPGMAAVYLLGAAGTVKRNNPWRTVYQPDVKGYFSEFLVSNIIGYLSFYWIRYALLTFTCSETQILFPIGGNTRCWRKNSWWRSVDSSASSDESLFTCTLVSPFLTVYYHKLFEETRCNTIQNKQ